MKKNLFTIAAWIVTSLSVYGQEKQMPERKFLLSFSGGPSFPVADFASKDINNSQAGFAITGHNLNLNFAYQQKTSFGFAGTLFYTKHGVDFTAFESSGYTGLSADHWIYYGMMIGPMVTLPAGEKLKTDLKILAGVTNVNMPQIGYNGTLMTEDQWAAAFAMQLSADLRYYFNKQLFVVMNIDYNAMKPKFKFTDTNGQISSATQRVQAAALSLGIGIAF